ncbi:MAG: hypothetical protein JXX28_13965 [Deltaproteobacteria bacterium]|nr:hypothetical protein [Deltaproteobacteria bacterium]
MHRWAPLLLLAACFGSVMPLYESSRDDALADPGPAPAAWQPDAMLHLSSGLIRTLVDATLSEGSPLSGTPIALGRMGTVTPDLQLNHLQVQSTDRCEDCLGVKARLGGRLGWEVLGQQGGMPAAGTVDMDFSVRAVQDRGQWTVAIAPKEVREVQINLNGTAIARAEGQLEGWLKTRLMEGVPPYELGPFGDESLPLRGLRLTPAPSGVRIAMLTTAPDAAPLRVSALKGSEGFRFDVSQSALLALARKAAFLGEPLSHGVIAEPTSLLFMPNRFQLGLRLWRPQGKGWWRDYQVSGEMAVSDGRLKLRPKSVDEGDKSQGAAVIDPLAALGEGIILQTIEEALATSFPVHKATTVSSFQAKVAVRTVVGIDQAVQVSGDVTLEPAGSRGQPRPGTSRPAGGDRPAQGGMNRPAGR